MKEFKEYPFCKGEDALIQIGFINGIVTCHVDCWNGSGLQVHKNISYEDHSSLNEVIDDLLTATSKARDGQPPGGDYIVHRWYLNECNDQPYLVQLYPTPSEEENDCEITFHKR